jgi:hypothetical protein
MGHEDRFWQPRLDGGCYRGLLTFARPSGNTEDAPFPDLPKVRKKPVGVVCRSEI